MQLDCLKIEEHEKNIPIIMKRQPSWMDVKCKIKLRNGFKTRAGTAETSKASNWAAKSVLRRKSGGNFPQRRKTEMTPNRTLLPASRESSPNEIRELGSLWLAGKGKWHFEMTDSYCGTWGNTYWRK